MNRREFVKAATGGIAAMAAARQAPARAEGGRKTYRVAVIGRTGRGNYGHGLAAVWKDFDRTQVVAVADEDPKGREGAARLLRAPKSYADYREMLEREKPDIVAVAPRWLDCHRDMVLACAEHGCHVFLEKPMCRTLAEADEMIAALEAKDLKAVIAHQTRYSPIVDRVKTMLADGVLGDLLDLRGRGKEDRRGGGEDLMVLGTHIMDLMRFFGGDATWCFARVYDGGKPVTKEHVRDGAEGIGPLAGDEIHAMYRFTSRSMGSFDTHRARHGAGKRFGLWIHGSKGIITMSTGSLPETWLIEDPSWQPGRSGATWVRVSSAGPGKPEPHKTANHADLGNRLTVLDLIRAIETDTRPRGSVHDGRAALEMILACYESHRFGKPVDLPLKNRQHPLTML